MMEEIVNIRKYPPPPTPPPHPKKKTQTGPRGFTNPDVKILGARTFSCKPRIRGSF